MRILLIDNGTNFLEKLQLLIPGDEIVLKPQYVSPTTSADFDLIILSGSSALTAVYDVEYFKNELDMIKHSTTPIVGICLGCELVALAFGGTLKRMEERHSGVRTIALTDHHFSSNSAVDVFESHRWIIDRPPEKFDILATSADGPEIIKHRTLPIWGLQFHPETARESTEGDEIFGTILSQIRL